MSKPLLVDIQHKTVTVAQKPLQILGQIKFEVEAGQFVCLLGPSGCGKTTILRLILGLDTVYEGNIWLDSQRVQGPGLDRGIVFQEPRLIPWKSVRKNIEFAIPAQDNIHKAQEYVSQMISLVGLSGFENAWPNQLSGGMAQRAAIARALVNLPSLLLMDEPFGALDSYTRMSMQEELMRIHERNGITTLMVTHDVDEAVFLSDRIIVLTPHPAEIRANFRTALPKTRVRTSHAFLEIRTRVMEAFYA